MDTNFQIIQLAQQLLYTPNLLQAELKNIYDVSLALLSLICSISPFNAIKFILNATNLIFFLSLTQALIINDSNCFQNIDFEVRVKGRTQKLKLVPT